jgi:DNA repair ATPase RecN
MATQANLASTEALESFRASLIVFLVKSRRSLDEVHDEVRRTRQWLQQDQRMHWEGELRRRTKQLEQAQQDLMSVRLGAASHQQSAVMTRQRAVAKAQCEFAEAEGKLRKLKGWSQNYDTCVDPILKRMDKLRQSLDEIPQAIAYLASVQKTLDAYVDSAGVASAPSSLSSPEPQPGPE